MPEAAEPRPDSEGEPSAASVDVESVDVGLERDVFLRTLIRELAGTLEGVVGLEEASGFVSVVGQRVADWIDAKYRDALGKDRFEREELARVLVDLKRRIQGDFRIEEVDEEKIVLSNRACPFGDRVLGRPSLCMMTSNVFGSLAAEHCGYARVELLETIAEGHAGCRVVVRLRPIPGATRGREYYRK